MSEDDGQPDEAKEWEDFEGPQEYESEYCSCEPGEVFIGSMRCELCGKLNYNAIHAMDKYRCNKCGKIMGMGQEYHDLKEHRFG